MEPKKLTRLANELTDFCLEYRIFNISCGAREFKQRMEELFYDVIFVEELINLIIVKAKDQKDIDTGKLVELLSELERLRLELEYRAPERAGEKCQVLSRR